MQNWHIKRHVVGLDILRVGAALYVMLFHLGYFHWIVDPHMPMPTAFRPWEPIFSLGWIGVEIFFVISGFVIAYSIQSISAAEFAVHRLRRLIPTAILCASITALGILSERLVPPPRLPFGGCAVLRSGPQGLGSTAPTGHFRWRLRSTSWFSSAFW